MRDGNALLIKKICMYLRRPVFEVLEFPAEELEHWSLFFSIDDDLRDKDKRKTLLSQPVLAELSVDDAKSEMRKRLM